ncbi:MAG: protein kinase [Polyangiaceae bacterium]
MPAKPEHRSGHDSAVVSSRLALGSVLAGRYRIEAHLGAGGMGDVYRVHDQRLGEDVALKLVSFDHELAAERFHREVKFARRITHPNVARTHDIGEHEGRSFLTMEYIAGRTLGDRMRESSPLPVEEAVGVSLAVAKGLSAAHGANVIHRDLKPANVMIEVTGRVVITDFGVARSLAEDLTLDGSHTVGTPDYMAPEQVTGLDVSPASDVYALGLLLYEMLTAALPFEGATPMAAMVARCREAPRDPRRVGSVPDPLAELILACLRLPAAERPPLSVVISRLETWSSASSARTVASITPTSVPSISSPFAPISLGTKRLAVLPFRYRGSAEHDYLGDSLAQELIDELSRMRGMKVLAFGATAGHRDGDPRAVGRELGAETIVGGDVMASGEKVRVAVRMLDVDSGTQLWTERFTTELSDVFRMQEIVSQRIAEALRLELDVAGEQWRVSAETTNLYLRGRRALENGNYEGTEGALELFERCIAREQFKPAIGAHALGTMQAWWMALTHGSERDWAELADQSVTRAMEKAPELAESHFAAGALAVQTGQMAKAARHLADALDIAPAFVEAQRYLGELQCEAGRAKEGVKRLHLVLELNPSRVSAYIGLSRIAALEGDFDKAARYARAVDTDPNLAVAALICRMRYGAWQDDLDAVRRAIAEASKKQGAAVGFIAQYGQFIVGEGDLAVIDTAVAFAEGFGNPRMVSMVGQLSVEALAARDHHDKALELLQRIASGALVDLAWLQQCHVLDSIRDDPRYLEALGKTRARAEALWQV